MMTDPAPATDPLAALAEAGAHFVLCNRDKHPLTRAWQKTGAPLVAAQRHRDEGGLVGLVPASVGAVVIDVDTGGAEAGDAVVALLGAPIVRVPTRRPGGEHVWYRCREAADVRNGAWRDGDIRGGHGYVIAWTPASIAEALAADGAFADLMAIDISRLPRKAAKVVQLTPEGGRNVALNNGVFTAVRDGRDPTPHIEGARASGLPEREIAATAASAVAGAKRAGVSVFIDNAWSSDGLAKAFEVIGVATRFNTRGKRYEYRLDGAWHAADDRRDSAVRQAIARRCTARKGSNKEPVPLKYAAETFVDLRHAICDAARVDPFAVFLASLPEWDGQPRIDSLLGAMFGAADDELSRWASRYIGLASVERCAKPGAKIDEVPVLLGEQGAGKSHFVRAWFTEDQHEFHGDAVDLGARPKEQAEALAGRVCCELSELTGIRKAEVERLKSFISRQDDGQFRWAYARSPEPSPRMVCFVGTTNNDSCLPNDPSGNRRFCVIALPHGCDVAAASVDREQWWCEAKERYANGERAGLPRELHAEARERAEEHREVDALESEVRDTVHDFDGKPFAIADLYYALPNNSLARPPDRAMQMRLANALKQLGYSNKLRRKDGTPQRLWAR